MNRCTWAHLLAAALAAAAFTVAAPPAAVAAPTPDVAAAATAYLEARAAAVTATHPLAVLGPWVAPESGLARSEAMLARGAALRSRHLGHAVVSVACRVTALDVATATDGLSATVGAHVITTTRWSAPSGASDVESSGIDHTLTLGRAAGAWTVTADTYSDVLRPSLLEAAGASRTRVRAAARALERDSTPLALPPSGGRRAPVRRYSDIIVYDRPAAQAFADKYALSYNPTYVHFEADCANFASQCAYAGSMPLSGGAVGSGWWYDKSGTSSPSDDTYSLSWINVGKQISFWNGRRTDWETSAGVLSRGDFIYYDWTGDGVWEHVAVVAGTNSAGQKIIDAHTTDHYRVFWKLGTGSTRYKYARVRPQWVV
jgi:hypothetical protein